MIKLNGNVLTEKGVVKAQARKAVVDYVAANPSVFAKAKAVKGGYVLPIEDSEGNTIYVNFEVSVSANSLEDRAPKARKAKSNVIMEHFDIED